MKRLVSLFFVLCLISESYSQDTTEINTRIDTTGPAIATPSPRRWNAANASNRSSDHLMIQVGFNGWAQKPDSINLRGIARSFNVYFMFDFPFKTSPQFSIGVGVGLSTNNIYFDKTYIDIAGRNNNQLRFQDMSDTSHFKKYKLLTTYLEAPVELRWMSDPYKPNKSWKAAIGAKVGTLLSAGTKGKTLQNRNEQTLLAFTQKEKSRQFFNGTRISVTGRVGLGNFGIFGSYQVNNFIKEGLGPDIRPYNIGLSFSGL